MNERHQGARGVMKMRRFARQDHKARLWTSCALGVLIAFGMPSTARSGFDIEGNASSSPTPSESETNQKDGSDVDIFAQKLPFRVLISDIVPNDIQIMMKGDVDSNREVTYQGSGPWQDVVKGLVDKLGYQVMMTPRLVYIEATAPRKLDPHLALLCPGQIRKHRKRM